MKVYYFLLTLCLSVVSCNQSGTDNNNNNLNNNNNNRGEASMNNNENPDKDFAKNAAEAGLFEVRVGELAQTKGTTQEVKNFAMHMVEEHGKANAELKALAGTKNIELPATLSEGQQKKYDNLAEKNGVDFDKEYADMMVKGHKDVLDAFEKEATNGKDAALKSWAEGKVPVIRHHLEMAEQMKFSLEKSN